MTIRSAERKAIQYTGFFGYEPVGTKYYVSEPQIYDPENGRYGYRKDTKGIHVLKIPYDT